MNVTIPHTHTYIHTHPSSQCLQKQQCLADTLHRNRTSRKAHQAHIGTLWQGLPSLFTATVQHLISNYKNAFTMG